ncbi:hypothetical protein L195_g028167 [Trifolium pratense]|uniref:Uncharacterized protein n=1 Tax=Trifolium pratense TaxID=57577 RepID=A0A2K3L158_TRIPR|nr:hypothetical protein L195_g028167 [Trifolium pratense]
MPTTTTTTASLVDRRNDKAIENSHSQSGVTGVRTPIPTSDTSNFGISTMRDTITNDKPLYFSLHNNTAMPRKKMRGTRNQKRKTRLDDDANVSHSESTTNMNKWNHIWDIMRLKLLEIQL